MEGGGGGGGGELNLAAAWAGWQEAQLGAQTARLTEQAQAVLQRIEETRARRKVLAAETKRFRADAASVPEALLVKFSALVQSYQREVDHLTHRAKAAESEFLKLFKTLREQVDPCLLLQRLKEDHDRNVRALEDMSEKYRGKTAAVKRLEQQLQNTETNIIAKVAELKKKWKLESKQKFETRLRQKTDSLQAELAEQSSASAAEIAQLQGEVDALADDNQRLTEELQKAQAAARRRSSSAVIKGTNAESHSSDAESPTATSESSSPHGGFVMLEDENGRLKAEVQRCKDREARARQDAAAAQAKISQLQAELSATVAEKQAAKETCKKTTEELQSLRESHASTATLRGQIAILQNELAVLAPLVGRDDLSSIKDMASAYARVNELDSENTDSGIDNQDVHMNVDGGNVVGTSTARRSSDATVAPSTSASLVRAWFVQNNKALRSQLTDKENELDEAHKATARAEQQAQVLLAEIEQKQNTISGLESSLQLASEGRQSAETTKQASTTVITSPSKENSLLDLVSAQRDHFRSELQRQETLAHQRTRAIASLQADLSAARAAAVCSALAIFELAE
eukprot:INCI18823.2.p1 GENE.INCI18823.2~~INCI18823.2.p1  ORF type:complete len:589 (+),score=135.25 INCI18823.2:48-1769(+)